VQSKCTESATEINCTVEHVDRFKMKVSLSFCLKTNKHGRIKANVRLIVEMSKLCNTPDGGRGWMVRGGGETF